MSEGVKGDSGFSLGACGGFMASFSVHNCVSIRWFLSRAGSKSVILYKRGRLLSGG